MKRLALLALAVMAAPCSVLADSEVKVPKNKVLEACGTQKYASVLTEIDGLQVRFYCDPYMPPLLLNSAGSSADKKETRTKPGPAISETLPECPPSDKAYGLCEMTRLDRELRQKMMELEEKKSFARLKAAEERAAMEEERKKLPPPPPPCTPLKDVGIFQGMNLEILGALGTLLRIVPVTGDVRLTFLMKRPALYGPMSRVQEGDLLAIDAIASRSQYAVPVLPGITVTKEQAGNLCLTGVKTGELSAAKPLTAILSDHAQAKPQAGKVRLSNPAGREEDGDDLPASGPIKLPGTTPGAGGAGAGAGGQGSPIQIVPAK